MDPITITTILAGKAVIGAIGAATTAIGFSSLVNAYSAKKNREFQKSMQEKNHELQKDLQEKQQAFTLAIEERRLNEAANLQREIVRIQHENALKLQEKAFDEQRTRESYRNFCDNVWPLQAAPDFYVEYLKKSYSESMMPLQIIVPATMPKDSFNGIDNPLTMFFNDTYSPRSGASAFYYNQGWKSTMYGSSGNAQITALHSVLAGLPTLILVLQQVGDEYCARVSFWGVADMALPENKTIFTVSQKELDLDILRDEADQIIKEFREYNIPLPQDKNIQTRLNELQRKEELEKQGNIPETVIKNILKREFANQYSKAGKEGVILQERNKYLSVMLEIVSAAFTDAYYLTTYNISPRIPELCASNPDFQSPQVIGLFQQIFTGLLELTSADTLNTPLRYAVVADSFKRCGFEEIALTYAEKSAGMLQDLQQKKAQFAPQHVQALELLDHYPEFADLCGQFKALDTAPSANLITMASFDEEFPSAIPLGNGVTLEMIRVKAGSFMMGSPEDEIGRENDEKLHKVTLTQDYYLGKYQVTSRQFYSIMEFHTSYFSSSLSDASVEQVDWNTAKEFCIRLNKKFKDKLPNGYQFDLPTEAQWEYACRAGTTTAYFWGNTCNGTEANCDGNYPCGTTCKGPYLEKTAIVGSYAPNDWGFYDMHGNVYEWCRDRYGEYDGDATDPTGPASDSGRVCRGGSWDGSARCCRSARRGSRSPGDRYYFLGFRLALVPVQ